MKSTAYSGAPAVGAPSLERQNEAAELAAPIAALPHGASRRHGWPWWICHSILWLVILGLLTAALLRVFHHDGSHFLTWINAFTRYVYLPAYVCLVWAVWMRRWALSLVSFTVVALHVAWMLPDFVRDRRFDIPAATVASAAAESQIVRIFFANVLASNHDFNPLWKEIETAKPDIVVLAESTQFSDQSFRQNPVMADYVHTNGRRLSQFFEVKIFSKLPIVAESQDWVAERIVQTVDVQVGGKTLRVIGIHAPRPQRRGYDYFGYWDRLVPSLTAEPGPVVIIGDFNATQHSLVYRQLEQGGLRSAHEDRGRGYATTWPNGRWLLPPIRIDQAFLSADVECCEITEGRGAGSDHKPLVLDIALRSIAPGGADPAVGK